MVAPKREAYIKSDHQALLIEGLRQFNGSILEFSSAYIEESSLRATAQRVAQFVILLLVALAFGIAPGKFLAALDAPCFADFRAYIASLAGKFPGHSSADRRVGRILYACRDSPPLAASLETLATNFIDYYYPAVGDGARGAFGEILGSTRATMTPPTECFVGVAKASVLFPSLGGKALGEIAPFFNAWVYKQARRGTSTAELVGDLRKPSIEGGRATFRDAAELGFVCGPPETKKFYAAFSFIEANIDPAWDFANMELARLGAHDLTATTADGTSVPVDKRDRTGSVGTGSRGTFSGHKLSAGAGSNCLPISGAVSGGRVSDVSLLDATLAPMEALARASGQDTWATILDGGYSSPGVIDRVESGGAVPFVDVNPKNSALLQVMKDAAQPLKDLSKKALKEGLTAEERKAWLREAQSISEEYGDFVPVGEKKGFLKRILRKFAGWARRRGLSPGERRTEKKLRKKVMEARLEISRHGTPEEKRVGLQAFAVGTIEWYVVYFIRGQNEGINGLLKKRGALIGDGQHTSWMTGHAAIEGRSRGDLAGLCLVALVKVRITSATAHSLRAIHHWSRKPKSFWAIVIVSLCR